MKSILGCAVIWVIVSCIVGTANGHVLLYEVPKLTVEQYFDAQEIVPDILKKAPELEARVIFASEAVANFGNKLTPTETKDAPSVFWENLADEYYTLALVDPDAPSREVPSLRSFKHWLVGNIRGAHVDEGEVLSAYIGPAPPPGSGFHRYVVLVYRQPGLLEFDEPRQNSTLIDERSNFSVANFAAKYNLGDPIAGNFYLAEFDAFVPILRQQFSNKSKHILSHGSLD